MGYIHILTYDNFGIELTNTEINFIIFDNYTQAHFYLPDFIMKICWHIYCERIYIESLGGIIKI